MHWCRWWLSLLLLLSLPVWGQSATYYAQPGGANNGCTPNNAGVRRNSLNAGIACLSAGDTLVLGNGNYDEQPNTCGIPNGNGPADTQRTIIKAENLRQAVIRPPQNGTVFNIRSCGSQNITFDGFVIDKQNQHSGEGFLHNESNADITIQNTEIRNFLRTGSCSPSQAFGGGESQRIVVRHNLIHDIGTDDCTADHGDIEPDCNYSYGYYLASNTPVVIEGNEWYNISAFAIHGYPGGGAHIFRNNYLHNTGAVLFNNNPGAQVYNNIIVDSFKGAACYTFQPFAAIWGNTPGGLFAFNTIVGAREDCLLMSGGNLTVQNNICYQNGTDPPTLSGSGNTVNHNSCGTSGGGCDLVGAPGFTGTGSGAQVYQLDPTSTRIDQGTPISGIATDFSGVTNRFLGQNPDIGAWEAGSQIINPPTMTSLNIHQGAPTSFTADEAWMGLGLDSTGRVWAAFSSYLTVGSTGDIGLVRYTPSTTTMEWMTWVSQIAANAGNLNAGERFAKIHVDFRPWNNKLYFATHDFHDETQPSEVRGSHVMLYDTTTNTFDDLSRLMPTGVAVQQQGIIGMDIVPSTGMLIGITYPVGTLIRIPLTSGTPTPSLTNPPIAGAQMTRKVLATTRGGGTGYVSYYPNNPNPSTLYAIDASNGAVRATSNTVAYGIMQGRVLTRDGTTAYLLDEFGRLYRLDTASEALTDLGYLIGDAAFALYGHSDGLALSNDESYLFTWVSSWEQNHGGLFSYQIATGTRQEEATFADPARGWDRRTTAMTIDWLGNIYVIDHAPSHIDEGRLLHIANVPHSPALGVLPGPTEPGPLIAYWRFNEGSGTTVADTTDATENMVAQNLTFTTATPPTWTTPSFATGQGSALSCPLSTSGATAGSALPITTQYSWAGWFRATTIPGNTGQELFNGDGQGLFGFDWGHTTPTTNAQAAFHKLNANAWAAAKIQTPLLANTWYWVGATWNGSQLRVFLNGQPAAPTVAAPTMAAVSGPPIVCPFWGTGTGTVDELKIWNTALNDAQMLAQYQRYTGTPARAPRHRRPPP